MKTKTRLRRRNEQDQGEREKWRRGGKGAQDINGQKYQIPLL